MEKTSIIFIAAFVLLGSCGKKANNKEEEISNKTDTASVETVEDTAQVAKGLNNIRFGNFSDNDWIDNDYIRELRRYLDDYNSGRIEDQELDPYKDIVKGKFVIGWSEPFIMGGLFLRIIFIDAPEQLFAAWVYSDVDKDDEKVVGYHTRWVKPDDEEQKMNKEEILNLIKEHPEYKLW